MRKMLSLYPRNFQSKGNLYITSQVNKGVDWVFHPSTVATQKFDGTCCFYDETTKQLYKRFDYKRKSSRSLPTGALACQFEPDEHTGHWPHWIPLIKGDPENWMHELAPMPTIHGTYELCGPKINENREKLETYQFIKHGSVIFDKVPLTLPGLTKFLKEHDIEGIVFYEAMGVFGPVGRMAKVTKEGFGMKR